MFMVIVFLASCQTVIDALNIRSVYWDVNTYISNSAVVRMLYCKSPCCGLESGLYLCLWDMFPQESPLGHVSQV